MPVRTERKFMNTKLAHLVELNTGLDSILNFDYYDEDERRRGGAGTTGGALGLGLLAGAGGIYGHQAIQRTGGYGANIERLGKSLAAAPGAAGTAIKEQAGKVGAGASSLGRQASDYAGKVGGQIGDLSRQVAARTARAGRQVQSGASGLSAATRYEIARGAGSYKNLLDPAVLKRIGTRALTRAKFTYSDRSKAVRLQEISSLLSFAMDDDDDRRSGLGTAVAGAAGVGAGVGGVLGHQAILRNGGYGAVAKRAGVAARAGAGAATDSFKTGATKAGDAIAGAAAKTGEAVTGAAKTGTSALQSLWLKLAGGAAKAA